MCRHEKMGNSAVLELLQMENISLMSKGSKGDSLYKSGTTKEEKVFILHPEILSAPTCQFGKLFLLKLGITSSVNASLCLPHNFVFSFSMGPLCRVDPI